MLEVQLLDMNPQGGTGRVSWTVPTAQSPTCRSQTGSRSTSEGAGPSPSSLCNPASPCWGGMKEWDEPAASWVGGGTQHTEPPRVTNAAQIHKHHEIPAATRHNVVAEVTPRGPVIIHLAIPHPIPTLWEHSLFFWHLSASEPGHENPRFLFTLPPLHQPHPWQEWHR